MRTWRTWSQESGGRHASASRSCSTRSPRRRAGSDVVPRSRRPGRTSRRAEARPRSAPSPVRRGSPPSRPGWPGSTPLTTSRWGWLRRSSRDAGVASRRAGYGKFVPSLPSPRGPVSEALIRALGQPPGAEFACLVPATADALADEDLQLALYIAYELHYRGFDGVDDCWEWDAELLRFRAGLETAFEDALRAVVAVPSVPPPGDIDVALRELSDPGDRPSLSRYLEREATVGQVREFLVHRSAYQLKEADPHSFALPRLWGKPKAAMVEIQADEYGGGREDRIHAVLFARALRAFGLDDGYGAYLDVTPARTLATVNLMSLFGLHRRLRGALVGHLALFEMTSSIPNGRYAAAARRLGFSDADATGFFDEHVTADAVHESIAAVDLAGGLATQQPELSADILWGAAALMALDAAWEDDVLAAFAAGRSSLREPVAPAALA
ncbi:MAG: iron-containing redox enzyme family protein [Solirubrobacteraceae bacterium]|nr:iron-containing redox enzyme family protein [Solirubrobacteraceae bacterium]